jgi:hypothetical protein
MTPVFALLLLLNVPIGTIASPNASAIIVAPAASPSILPVPPSTPTPAPVFTTWMGVSLGQASKDAKMSLGKPREIVPSSIGALWRYDVDNGNATLELVINQDRLLNIAVRVKDGKRSVVADPFGATLGMSAQALQTMRGIPIATYGKGANLAYGDPVGVRWFYTLDAGVVTGIEVSQPIAPPLAPQVISDASHDGSREGKAFLVKAATDIESTNAEYTFLRTLACDAGGTWKPVGQELVSAGGRYYDLMHVSCSTTKVPRDFYFDITQGFGK